MPRFTIIIPVYNAEKRIQKTLDSLIQQPYTDFEVIVVDDGSTDSSANIVTNYSHQDSRIKRYQKINSGVSSARNLGLSKANGDYITFVDSDDEVTANYLTSLDREIINSEADIIFFVYTSINELNQSSEIRVAQNIAKSITKIEKIEFLDNNDLYGYAWCKCYKRECIGSVRYREDLCLLEDEIFIGEIICKTNQIAILPEALYRYYSYNSNSLCGKTYQNYCEICDEAFKTWVRLFPFEHRAIRKKALSLFTKCMYYSFERDVHFTSFIQALRNTTYTRHLNGSSCWVNMVQLGKLRRLKYHKLLYTVKNHLFKKIKSIFRHA